MTQEISLGNWIIRCDPGWIRKYFAKTMHDWCPCDRCYSWRIVRDRFVPSAIKERLDVFGLEPGNCMWDGRSWDSRPTLPGYYRERPNYIIPGTIVREGTNPAYRYRNLGSISVTPERVKERFGRDNDFPDLPEPLIYLRVRVPIPFLPRQMRSFEQRTDFRCPTCNLTDFYVTGRLKKTSLIPEWYGVDLGKRPHDYDACFCSHCGTPRFVRRD